MFEDTRRRRLNIYECGYIFNRGMRTHISTGGRGSALQSPKSTPVDKDDRVDAMSFATFSWLDDFSRHEKNLYAGVIKEKQALEDSIKEKQALEDSIKRWERIFEDPTCFRDDWCSLCKFHDGCSKCIIRITTGKYLCQGTPFHLFQTQYEELENYAKGSEYYNDEIEELKELALVEVNFLKALRR